jgi:ABC-2 type transport system permease protein
LQVLFQKIDAEKEKKFVVIDRSPREVMATYLKESLKVKEDARAKDESGKAYFGGRVALEIVPPSEPTPEAMGRQRFEISQRIERGEIEGLVEIGPNVLERGLRGEGLSRPDKVDDAEAVRFQAKSAGAQFFRRDIENWLSQAIQFVYVTTKGLTDKDFKHVVEYRVPVKTKSLTRQDATTGTYTDAPDQTRIVNIIIPGVLIGLMFMVVMVGATPAMHGIFEEKSQRIAEVLLGSVTPFQLMAGKLLGIIGVALTMSIVYLGGGCFLVAYYGYADFLPLHVLAWYLPLMVLALLIFGSLFIAVGAAAADIKDTQTLLMPIMLFACLPMFALGPIMMEPNGPIARVATFFPFATPMILVAREAVPPGVPWWEMLAGVAVVLVTTWICVWAASRIFRVGILMHGKGPKFGDLVRWAIKG